MRTLIVATLLLTSCGAAAEIPAAKPGPDTTAAKTSIASPATVAPTDPAATVAAGITDSTAAFPARLALTTKDGQIVTFSPHEDPIVTPGVMSPNGKVVVSASYMGGQTMVEWHDVRTDQIAPPVMIDGDFHPTAVAQDDKLVALVGSA